MTARRAAALLTLVVALAATLRVAGIRYGLPDVFNMDEVAIMSRTLAFAKGDLNPHNFLYPTFYFYVLFGWLGAYFVLALALGWVASLQAFQASFFNDPTGIYVAGRLLSVICGVATVWLTYRLATRLFDRTTALVASLFLAVAPFAVRDAHYVKHDIPVTMAITAAVLALARVWGFGEPHPEQARSSQVRSLACAAALCGVACSTHYYAVFLALPLAVGAVLQSWREGTAAVLRRLALAAAVMLAIFAACSPFLPFEWQTAWRDVVANRQIVVDRALQGSAGDTISRYAAMLMFESMGWPVSILGLAGAMWLVARSPLRALLLLLFPLAFLAFISNTVPASRYLNPVLPILAVLAAHAARNLSVRLPGRIQGAGMAVLALLAAAPGAVDSIRNDWLFRQDDTRTRARRYIESTVPAGATILVQPYSVALQQSHAALREALLNRLGSLDQIPTKFALRLKFAEPVPAYRPIYLGDGGLDQDKIYIHYGQIADKLNPLAVLRRQGVQYVVLKRYNVVEPATEPLRDALGREGRLLATFSPYRSSAGTALGRVAPFLHNTDATIDPALERPGPLVEVWQLDDPRPPA
jgi:hypothetical protein